MVTPEPIPPPQGPSRNADRELHTSLQLPTEARWSRPSSIVLSVLVHIALFFFIRHLIVKPVEKPGPVFQVFQLDAAPHEKPVPIKAPPIEVPKTEVARVEPTTRIEKPPTSPETNVPALTQPVNVPTELPPPGAAVAEPSLVAPQPPRAPLTAAERFLRTTIDPALVPEAPGLPPMLTPREAAAARLATGMKQYNDSVAGVLADRKAAREAWVKTDKNGGKWGVDPTGIHIGSITIPIPNFAFAGPTGRRDENNAKVRSFNETNAQAKRMELEETFESRAKAMRKRKDAQRDTTRVVRPDHQPSP